MRKDLKTRLYALTVTDPSGCVRYVGKHVGKGGYRRIRAGSNKRRLVHRVAYELAHGPIPEGMAVCHRCDVRDCVNPDHLFVGTRADNSRDMVQKGRQAKGEKQGSAKLTREIVQYIRSVAVPGDREFGNAALGRKFGVSPTYLSKVVHGQRWADNEARRVAPGRKRAA